jgi:hypothetical protein
MSDYEMATSHEDEHAWQEVCRDFISITDEMVHLRMGRIEQLYTENGMDFQSALESYDPVEGEHLSHSAQIIDDIREVLMQHESDMAVSLLRIEKRNQAMFVPEPGIFFSSEPIPVHGVELQRKQWHRIRGNRIEKLTFDTPAMIDEEQEINLIDMVADALDSGDMQWEEVPLKNATSLVRALGVIRRYVGKDMYDRTPLPTDPA